MQLCRFQVIPVLPDPPDIGGGLLMKDPQVGFIRNFFNHQELPTDEAVVAWNDQTIKDFHDLNVK